MRLTVDGVESLLVNRLVDPPTFDPTQSDGGAGMTAVLPDREPTAAELEQSPLVAEVERVRELLEAYRDGTPAPPRDDPDPSEFEPAVDRLARLLGLSAFERQLAAARGRGRARRRRGRARRGAR